MKSSCDVIHDASNLSTYVQHVLWNYPSRALREQKNKQLTARGPGSTVCTASLRKSAEPAASLPRRVPARGRAVSLQADTKNIDDVPLNLPKHTSPDPKC